MSKSALKSYLSQLSHNQLEAQFLELYAKFPSVRKYYDFVFNPREDKLVGEIKEKISNEYFPLKRKRPRARRSVAQKAIKQCLIFGMDPYLVADVMLYNLETAQSFSSARMQPVAFYKSMLNSFTEALRFISAHGLLSEFRGRIGRIYEAVLEQGWPFEQDFSRMLDLIE